MKTIKDNKTKFLGLILIFSVLLAGFYGFSRHRLPAPAPPTPQYLIDYRNNIVGTFIGEKDTDWKLEFTSSGKCYWYDEGVLISVNTYSISNTTPQCGMNVSVDENTETGYLSLFDDADGMPLCYSINGITNAVLSLRPVGEGGFLVLNKQ